MALKLSRPAAAILARRPVMQTKDMYIVRPKCSKVSMEFSWDLFMV